MPLKSVSGRKTVPWEMWTQLMLTRRSECGQKLTAGHSRILRSCRSAIFSPILVILWLGAERTNIQNLRFSSPFISFTLYAVLTLQIYCRGWMEVISRVFQRQSTTWIGTLNSIFLRFPDLGIFGLPSYPAELGVFGLSDIEKTYHNQARQTNKLPDYKDAQHASFW